MIISLILTSLSSVAFLIASGFQITKMVKTKTSEGISIPFLSLCVLGVLCVLILVYTTDNDLLTRVQQWINFGSIFCTLIFAVYYRVFNPKNKSLLDLENQFLYGDGKPEFPKSQNFADGTIKEQ